MVSSPPEIRYFIPCWKEPTFSGQGPSAHEILYSVKPKQGHGYPLWQRPFYILALVTNMHGVCEFHVEMRLEEFHKEILIEATDRFSLEMGNDPLRIQSVSIMMKATKLPRLGVYNLHFIWNEKKLASATVHAR